jgi:hypothetical protein
VELLLSQAASLYRSTPVFLQLFARSRFLSQSSEAEYWRHRWRANLKSFQGKLPVAAKKRAMSKHLLKAVRTANECADLVESRILENINGSGLATLHQPECCYTVGLWHHWAHPELIVFGLPAARADALLRTCGEAIRGGRRFQPQELVDDLVHEYSLRTESVRSEHFTQYLPYGRWYYRGPHFEALQLIWPDPDRRFPGEAEHLPRLRPLQPLLS